MMLRILTGHLFVIHICTAWAWLMLYENLKLLKPAILRADQWEPAIGLPMRFIYLMIGVFLIASTIFVKNEHDTHHRD